MFRRILMGIGANTLAQVSIAFIQLLAVPILIQSWGVTRYGTWLMIFTLPSALAISDFGFATSAGNDMTMKFAGTITTQYYKYTEAFGHWCF
jgi:hypothetical protein